MFRRLQGDKVHDFWSNDSRGQVRPRPAAHRYRAPARQLARQERIVAVAMRHFAGRGYEGVRIEEIRPGEAQTWPRARCSGYFTQQGRAVPGRLPGRRPLVSAATWRRRRGDFAGGLRGRRVLAPAHAAPDPRGLGDPVTLLWRTCSSLQLRREITQFLLRENRSAPEHSCGWVSSAAESAATSTPRWSCPGGLADRQLQDAIVTEELDPGLFGAAAESPQMRDVQVQQFVELLRSAIRAGSRVRCGAAGMTTGERVTGAGTWPSGRPRSPCVAQPRGHALSPRAAGRARPRAAGIFCPYRKDDAMLARDYELYAYLATPRLRGGQGGIRGTGSSEGELPGASTPSRNSATLRP